MDLGVSSYQLDERGHAVSLTGRMHHWICGWIRDRRMTARDIVNGYSESDLYRIIRDYGEDKFAKNIAKHIVRREK